jgi:heavy metal sensor kinase
MEQMGDVEEPMEALKKTLFWITPLAGLLAALGGYWLAARALRPVDQITRMAQTIGARQLSLRIPEPPVDDELGRLARTVNAMLGRLETSFEAMGRFTSDASHELRSPLAVLRSTLDVTLARTRSVEEYQEVLMSLEEEVARLQSITEDLLLLARADSGRIPLTRRPVRLVELARETADSFGPQAEEGGLTLVAPVPVTISGDERWLRQLLLNLLENAFRHGEAPVVLTVEPKEDGALISVSDAGPGIPPDKLDHVFERFYRTDPARTPGTSEGAGLGLSISAWIVQAHGGRLTASNRPGGGGLFVAWLPLEGA